MKELINSRIKKYFGTQIKFCDYQKYHFRGHVRKLERIENSIKKLNKFMNPLKLKVEVLDTDYDDLIYIDNMELEVSFDYTPAQPGDKYTPGTGETFEINNVSIKGVDVGELIDPKMEERILNKLYER
jgi:hypothetical protein